MISTRPAPFHLIVGALLAIAWALAAAPAFAQSSSQQAGRPQPPPTTSPAAPAQGVPSATAPKADGNAPAAGTQAAKPAAGGAQAPGAKAPAPKKPAPLQTSKVWKGRGFAVLSAGAQVAAPGYSSTAVFKVHAEDATLNADATVGAGPVFGARGGMRVWKNMAIGAGLELASTTQSLDVTGRLPHPFMFNKYRDVEGTASGLAREEALIAFEFSWLFALSRRIDMFVFGGPAYIYVRQDMATKILFSESYPYDTAAFVDVETASLSGGGAGATAGADIAYLVTKHLGVGGEVRYSYASATLKPAGQPAKVGLGGLQAAFGARILF